VFVKDVAWAFLEIVRHPEEARKEGVILIGSSEERSVRQVVSDCAAVAGVEGDGALAPLEVEDPRPFNDKRYISGQSSCIQNWLEGHNTEWREGLRQTRDWFVARK